MTPWHYRWLCRFSYIDLPEDLIKERGITLGRIAGELMARDERGGLPCGRLHDEEREALRVIRETGELSGLYLTEYINRNRGSGLAAYLFRAADGGMHVIFRGSESPGCGVPTGIDWVDNILAPFAGSVQYEEIRALAGRFPEERVVYSGHSKGAHNALYALAMTPNRRAAAVAFNGQGFAAGQLSRAQKDRLRAQGVNYVTRGDVVGVLLWHPERRVFVRKQGKGNAHALESFSFDGKGEPVPAMRTLWSAALEWGVKRYFLGAERALTGAN